MTAQLPVLVVLTPLIAAPLCVLTSSRRFSYLIALIATCVTFAFAMMLVGRVLAYGPIRYDMGGWKPPYGIEYLIDYLSGFMIVIVAGAAAIVLIYAPRSLDDEIPIEKHTLFHSCYLLCAAGLLGICMTGDLFNVFVFLEISSLSSYAMISLGKDRRALLASLQYLIMGTVGATFLLIGIGLLYQMTGTLNMSDIADRLPAEVKPRTMQVAFAFISVGLCIKMAVFPVHTWLPNAYTFAPSVVTSFLAATSTKVSVYALIRLIYGIVAPQFETLAMPLANELTLLALLGIFAASIAAVFQENVKQLLAYSSIAQIGYMLLGVGLANQDGVTAAVVHLFNHAVTKGALFMVVGCFALRLGSVRLDDWRGAGQTMPLTSLAWVVGGLSLVGVPLTVGFVSKWLLLTSSLESERWIVAVPMLGSSLLAVIYVWKVVEVLYFSSPSTAVLRSREAPLSMLIPTYLLIGCCILFGCWTDYTAGLAGLAAAFLLEGAQ